ncbi:MAG: SgcJ/EcaC family oxidoreductase [Longimicrobiales bacterium]
MHGRSRDRGGPPPRRPVRRTVRRPVLTALAALTCAWTVAPGQTAAQDATALPDTVALPDELGAVLRAYETAWEARDAEALAALFTDDGFVLRPGYPPVRGRSAIRTAYARSGGPLSLIAYDYAVEGDTGWIIGGYGPEPGFPPGGKYVLALRRVEGAWRIHADMDNGNR